MKKKVLYALQIILCGIFVGLLVSLFIFISGQCFKALDKISELKIKEFVIVSIFVFTIGMILSVLNKKYVGHIASGIGTLERYYEHNENFNSIVPMIIIMFNSFTAYIRGFIFGTEAPSIFIGASITKFISKIFKCEDKELVKAGASAGFAVAFLAPFAGVLHLIEEHKKDIGIKIILKAIFVIAIAYLTAYLVFKREPFGFMNIELLPIKYIYVPVVISLLATLIALLYRVMHKNVEGIAKYKNVMMYLTPFLGLGFLIFKRISPTLSGSGEMIVEENMLEYGLMFLFALMFARLILMIASESSYVSGGSVLPLLAMGAIASYIVIEIFGHAGIDLEKYGDSLILVGMCTCLGVGASIPITSGILGFELTKTIYILWPLAISLIFSVIFKKIVNLALYGRKNKREIFGQNDTV